MYLIIDGSSMLSTNYYGTLPFDLLMAKTEEDKQKAYKYIMHSPDGTYTNGVFTSLKQILKMAKFQQPEGIVVVLDESRNTFRREIYPEYKGQRSETPPPLKQQFATFKEVLQTIGIPVFSSDRYEADDYAGTIAKILEAAGKECVLISGDKDYYQLVSPQTKLWRIITTNARAKYEALYNINFDEYRRENNLPYGVFEVKDGDGIIAEKELVNLTPEQFVDYLAVAGDKSDNIPGIAGIGPMTIIPLLQKYGSLDEIYRVIHKAIQDKSDKQLYQAWKDELGIKKNPIATFVKHEDDATTSKKLAQIYVSIDDVPKNSEFYDLNIDNDALNAVIEKYAFETLKNSDV